MDRKKFKRIMFNAVRLVITARIVYVMIDLGRLAVVAPPDMLLWSIFTSLCLIFAMVMIMYLMWS